MINFYEVEDHTGWSSLTNVQGNLKILSTSSSSDLSNLNGISNIGDVINEANSNLCQPVVETYALTLPVKGTITVQNNNGICPSFVRGSRIDRNLFFLTL